MMLFKKRKKTQEEIIYEKGVTTLQDLLAPAGFQIESNSLRVGEKLIRTIFVFTYPRYLNTNWFTPIINLDQIMNISIFIHPTDSGVILKNLQKQVARVGAELMEKEEKGYVRDPMLETAYQDIESLRDNLQQGNERFYRVGLYITVYADTNEELNKTENEIITILEGKLVYAKPAIFQQDLGFVSTMPLSSDKLLITTPMNTLPLSSFFPFVSADLTSNKGILYGINVHNNSLVLFDRFSFENANTVIFGVSGGGKSYASKLEILRSLMLGTDVLVIDPENEYQHLAETVGGTYFKISLASPHHINPFDIPEVTENENPSDVLRSTIVNLVGLFKIMLGGLTTEEDAILDIALIETYASKDITEGSDFQGKTAPLLSDLEAVLSGMEGGKSLAIKLQKYTKGSYAEFFNNPTNVNIKNGLVVFNIRDMEEELRPVAMYMVIHHIWNIIKKNIKRRLLIVDEAWWLMKYESGASFLFGIAKRGRKYYLGLTTITQDIGDFMESPYGKPLVTNSAFQLIFKQSPATIDVVKKTFNLTNEEKFLLLESVVGEGLFFAGLKHIALKIIASYTEDQIITSDPKQIEAIRKAKEELET